MSVKFEMRLKFQNYIYIDIMCRCSKQTFTYIAVKFFQRMNHVESMHVDYCRVDT